MDECADQRLATAVPPAFDPFDPTIASNPHPVLRCLRDYGPAHYQAPIGQWVVTGYDEATTVLTNPAGSHNYVENQKLRLGRDATQERYCRATREWVLMKDGEEHSRIRRVLARNFGRGRVARLHDGMVTDAHALIDRFAGDGQVELIKAFATPLPLATIGRLMDVPVADQQKLEEIVDAFIVAAGPLPMNQQELDRANYCMGGFEDYFEQLIPERRKNPGDDLLTVMIQEADAGEWTHRELVANAWGLYVAGYETTMHAICCCVISLVNHPDQLELLRSDWTLIDNAVDELLRYDGSTVATIRYFPDPVQVGDDVVPAGTPALVYLSGPSRDPRRFENPDTLDITRRNAKDQFAFGAGPHACIGRHLARTALGVALEALFTRLPNLRIVGDLEWYERTVFHGPVALPVAWDLP
jgi:cytochrome P450